MTVTTTKNDIKSYDGDNIGRTSGYSKYPSIWNFDYVHLINNHYLDESEKYAGQHAKLKDNITKILNNIMDPLLQLEHIDILRRLGLSYLFEEQINRILSCFDKNIVWKDNVHATALKFRLLRENHFQVPQEVFNIFKDDETNNFKESISSDIVGLLSLYEASFLVLKDEKILEEARDFATKNLQEFVKLKKEKNEEKNDYVCVLVEHALEVPLHWRVPRLEARWFIDFICRSDIIKSDIILHNNIHPTFLELAILDFNLVQSKHLEELKQLYRWWRHSELGKKMSFCRDRCVENVLWNVGMISEPQHEYCRNICTKLFLLLTVVDDTYDSYGKLSELELFTSAFQSWNVEAMDSLPDYMKISFLAVYNFTNELAYDLLRDQGFNAMKYLKKLWADVSKCYLLEAKWYNSKIIPSFEEYYENGWVSIAAPIVLVIAYMCVTKKITEEAMEFLAMDDYPSIIRQASIIGRLTNDLATNPFEVEKGNVPTSIECYMHESGACEEKAREHIKYLIDEAWKTMNKDRVETSSTFSRMVIETCTNLPRMTMWFYEHRDGFGVEYQCLTKDCALSLLFNPIPFEGKLRSD